MSSENSNNSISHEFNNDHEAMDITITPTPTTNNFSSLRSTLPNQTQDHQIIRPIPIASLMPTPESSVSPTNNTIARINGNDAFQPPPVLSANSAFVQSYQKLQSDIEASMNQMRLLQQMQQQLQQQQFVHPDNMQRDMYQSEQLPLQNNLQAIKRKRIMSMSSNTSESSVLSSTSSSSRTNNHLMPPSKIRIIDDSSSNMSSALTGNELPIDTNTSMYSREMIFINDIGFDLKPMDDTTITTDPEATIIYSRCLKTHYIWPKEQPITVNMLKSKFEKTGHTISIDYTRTYNRLFALDLDCICRTKALSIVSHLDENQVQQIVTTMLAVMTKDLRLSMTQRKAIKYSVWRNGCGFHIYTNFPVSLPTHLELCQRITAELVYGHFIIEVPNNMPLPCSAKVFEQPYIEVNVPDISFNSISLTNTIPYTYHEMFELSTQYITSITMMKIGRSHTDSLIANSSSLYVNKNPKVQSLVAFIPAFGSTNNIISTIELNKTNFQHMTQFETYVTTVAEAYNKIRNALTEYNSTDSQSETDGDSVAIDTNGYVDLQKFSKQTVNNYLKFIATFYEKFKSGNAHENQQQPPITPIDENTGEDDANSNILDVLEDDNIDTTPTEPSTKYKRPLLFVRTSALMYGALHLQHFVALMFHSLQIQNRTFELFRKLLIEIYGETLMSTNTVIKQFVTTVNIDTFLDYSMNTNDMFEHLEYLYKWNVDPAHSFDQQLEMLMKSQLNVSSPQEYVLKLEKAQRVSSSKGASAADHSSNEVAKLAHHAIETFISILHKLYFMYYDYTTKRIYILTEGIYYTSDTQFNTSMLPLLIRLYLGVEAKANHIFNNELKNRSAAIYAKGRLSLTNSHFQYATKVGVFNSITGLYSSSISLLQFNKFRNISIWMRPVGENVDSNIRTTNQNYELLEMRKPVNKFLENIIENVFKLYAHFIIIPSIIQIPTLKTIEQYKIVKLFSILNNFDVCDHNCMHFLVEYFPFPPEYIYYIAELCRVTGSLEILGNYKRLTLAIFKQTKVSFQDWADKFESMFGDVTITYDKTATTTMGKLTSLNHPLLNGEPNNCMIYTITLACILKCRFYDRFIEGFKLKMSTTNYVHRDYEDFTPTETNRQSMIMNMNRAKRLVFGDNVSELENSMIDELLSLCISVDFKQEQLLNMIAMVGATHVPYNKSKKLFLFHGVTNVGKTYMCGKLTRMMGPKTISTVNFNDLCTRAVLSEASLVVLSEISKICPIQFKAITGNDATSAKRFFTQTYDLQHNQPHMFGGTNVHLDFNGSSLQQNVDRTTINRLYVIKLTGIQSETCRNDPNFFGMMIRRQYFPDLFESNKIETWALTWMTYMYYVNNRDSSGYAVLNNTSEESQQYKNYTYYRNNSLYRFLVHARLVDEPDFYIGARRLMSIVSNAVDKTNKDIGSVSAFITKFDNQYDANLHDAYACDQVVHNVQEVAFVNNVKLNMGVAPNPNSVITEEDLAPRIESYKNFEHQDNARLYFTMRNQYYLDQQSGVYKGIEFLTSKVDFDYNKSYNDTESDDIDDLRTSNPNYPTASESLIVPPPPQETNDNSQDLL